MVAFGVGGGVEGKSIQAIVRGGFKMIQARVGCIGEGLGNGLGTEDTFFHAATDPSGLGFLQSRTILHRSEHPKQPFSCFFVGVAAADLVDVDSGSGETDGFGGHGGGFAYKQSRGSLDVMHLFDRNMYTIGFKIGR